MYTQASKSPWYPDDNEYWCIFPFEYNFYDLAAFTVTPEWPSRLVWSVSIQPQPLFLSRVPPVLLSTIRRIWASGDVHQERVMKMHLIKFLWFLNFLSYKHKLYNIKKTKLLFHYDFLKYGGWRIAGWSHKSDKLYLS